MQEEDRRHDHQRRQEQSLPEEDDLLCLCDAGDLEDDQIDEARAHTQQQKREEGDEEALAPPIDHGHDDRISERHQHHRDHRAVRAVVDTVQEVAHTPSPPVTNG